MTNSLQNILNNVAIEGNVDISLLRSVKTNLEHSCLEDIVFYRVKPGERALKILVERLTRGNPGLVIFDNLPTIGVEPAHAVVTENDFFNLQKEICNVLYPINFEEKKIIGITGTNGKTSVCHFLSEILGHLGYSVLSIGTTGVGLRGSSGYKVLDEFGLTTPAYLYLRKLFFEYREQFDFVVMELSSHGLEQKRMGNVKIDLGIWTNFTRDHLDYHKTMKDYFLAKSEIFHYLKPSAHVVVHNDQNEILDRLEDWHLSKVASFELSELNLLQKNGNSLFMKGFMLKNVATAVFSIKVLLGVEVERLDFLTPPPGRFNIIRKRGKVVVVDYAHTPDALANLICLAKDYFAGKKVNVLFGCGGERDREKRGMMGRVVQKHANKIYLTSDNPRGEDPSEILNHIKLVLSRPFAENIDRRKMIKAAIDDMKADEVLLVAGKGHERYQEVEGIKHPFDDLKIVEECL